MDYIRELTTSGIPLPKDDVLYYARSLQRELADQKEKIKEELDTIEDVDVPRVLVRSLVAKGLKPRALTRDYYKTHRHEDSIYESLYQYEKKKWMIRTISDIYNKIDDDERLRGTWSANGSSTGRLSCRGPNLTALPGYIKKLCCPPSGRVLIMADYAQIELKILAEITQDQELIKALMEADMHAATAAKIFEKKVAEVTTEERQTCKALNYAVIYGCGSRGLRENIEKLGICCTLSEAANFRNRFLDVYPGIREYQKECCQATTLISFDGSTIQRSMLRPAQAINWPIQSGCSVIQKTALGIVMERKKSNTRLVNAIHDEIWLECSSVDADIESAMLLSAMREAFEKYVSVVPFGTDIIIKQEENNHEFPFE